MLLLAVGCGDVALPVFFLPVLFLVGLKGLDLLTELLRAGHFAPGLLTELSIV